MRVIINVFFFFFLLFTYSFAQQWPNTWTSSNINYTVTSGWIHFDKDGESWKSRLYFLDTLTFKIMQPGFNTTPQYTYTFTAAERLLGEQIYSTGYDLNKNNTADFYVLGGYGNSTTYRQAFKILDISTGEVLFQKDNASYYYSYPDFYDIDSDGTLEMIFIKYNWPSMINYTYEVYKINGTTGAPRENNKIEFRLLQNYPNPFNPATTIDYSISEPGFVKIRVFDIKGETIKILVNDYRQSGDHTAEWNGANDSGIRVPSGVYFYELLVNNQKQVNKMVLLK